MARIPGDGFTLDLVLTPTQPVLLQGDGGYSRKGPLPSQASGYYSEPNLAVTGTVKVGGQAIEAKGAAWLDHEWSSEILAENAVGWDWVGLNLEGGGALMAFRLRDKAGATVWASGTKRADGKLRVFANDEVRFTPRRTLALAAHGRHLARGDGLRGGGRALERGTAHGRPGNGRARLDRHPLLGRRGHGHAGPTGRRGAATWS